MSELTHAQMVRAEALRLAIEATAQFDGVGLSDLVATAEAIEKWLHEAAPPALVRGTAAQIIAMREAGGHG